MSVIFLLMSLGSSIASEKSSPEQTENPKTHTHGRDVWPMGGIKYDSVQKFTVSGCLCWKRKPEKMTCRNDFWIFQAQAGEGGGKLQGGIGRDMHFHMATGMAKLSLMQTWRDPVGVEPNQTYFGIEGQYTLLFMTVNIGLYTHVKGDSNDRNPLLTFGFGTGF